MSESKIVKPIIVTDNETGMEYTLEFTRDSIVFAERKGFEISDVSRFPMTKVPELWYYAFRAHHKGMPREKTDKLLERAGGFNEDLMVRLGELYALPFESLADADEENPTVTVKL